MKLVPVLLKRTLTNIFDLGTIKIVISTYQLIASLPWTLNVEFPEPFRGFLAVISILNLNLFGTVSLDCFGLPVPSYHMYVLITSIAPVIVTALIWAVHALRHGNVRNHEHQQDGTLNRGPMFWSLFISYLVAPGV